MDVDIQKLYDQGLIYLDDIMNSESCVLTEVGVIARGSTHSYEDDDDGKLVPATVILEKGNCCGVIAYRWFCRDQDDDHYDNDSEWHLSKSVAIHYSREWMKGDGNNEVPYGSNLEYRVVQLPDERANDPDEIIGKILATNWFDDSVKSDQITEIIDTMTTFTDKGVIKVWKDANFKRVDSPTDYDKAGYQVFVVCDEHAWLTHANHLLTAIEAYENDE